MLQITPAAEQEVLNVLNSPTNGNIGRNNNKLKLLQLAVSKDKKITIDYTCFFQGHQYEFLGKDMEVCVSAGLGSIITQFKNCTIDLLDGKLVVLGDLASI